MNDPIPAAPQASARPHRRQGEALRVGLRPSLDPGSGRTCQRPNGIRSDKIRSPRFEGIARGGWFTGLADQGVRRGVSIDGS